MKIALVIPGSIWYAPYIRNYTNLLTQWGVEHAIISWNREGNDNPEGFQYNERCINGHNSAGFYAYYKYVKFVKKTIKKQGFHKIIVFGPQMTCLLSTFLLRHFKNRYMLDYRDLSIEQKVGFKQLYSIMLSFSCANVISSPGFKRCLPKREFYLSHNFNATTIKKTLESENGDTFNVTDGIDILTIGAIRDYSSNIEVVKALANKKGYNLRFVGKGDSATRIKQYCIKHNIKNISFTGFYQKNEELDYVKKSTFLNIFYPRIITHDTALSNRFYISLLCKKPMIVTKNTTQGDYVEKYNVGIAVENCNELESKLQDFLHTDYMAYTQRCNNLLKSFLKDQFEFENALKRFVTE